METITTYMASGECGSPITEVDQGDAQISGHLISVFMIPLSNGIKYPGNVTMNLLQTGKDPYNDVPFIQDAILINDDPEDADKKNIVYANPSQNFDKWEKTTVMVSGTDGRVFAQAIERTSGGGVIPILQADVITPAGPFTKELNNNSIVPGELLYPKWEFRDINGVKHIANMTQSGKFFNTQYLTGGRIKSMVGNFDDFGLKFYVTVEGADLLCRPSDFIKWAIGDWVFLSNATALITDWVILPIQINGKAA